MKYKWKFLDNIVIEDYLPYSFYTGLPGESNQQYFSYLEGSGGAIEFFVNPWDEETKTFETPITTFYTPVGRPNPVQYSHFGRGLYKYYFYRSYHPTLSSQNREIDYSSIDGGISGNIHLGPINGVQDYWIRSIFEVSHNHIVVGISASQYSSTITRFVVPLASTYFTTTGAATSKPLLMRAPPSEYGESYFDDGTDLYYVDGTPNGFYSQGAENMEPALPTSYGWVEQWNWYTNKIPWNPSEDYTLRIATYNGEYEMLFENIPYDITHDYDGIILENPISHWDEHRFPRGLIKLAHPCSGEGPVSLALSPDVDWDIATPSVVDYSYPILTTEQGEIIRYISGIGYRFKNTLSTWAYNSCEYYRHIKQADWWVNNFFKVWYVDEEHIYALVQEQDNEIEDLYSLWKMLPVTGSAETGPNTQGAFKTNNKYGTG